MEIMKAEFNDSFTHAQANANQNCPKCKGTGAYKYDHNHSTICRLCCKHDRDFWLLEEYYGENNGKWCCRAGCGFMLTFDPDIPKP